MRAELVVARAGALLRGITRGAVDLLMPSACAVCRAPHRVETDGVVCGGFGGGRWHVYS